MEDLEPREEEEGGELVSLGIVVASLCEVLLGDSVQRTESSSELLGRSSFAQK